MAVNGYATAAGQKALWGGQNGEAWVAAQDLLDDLFRPIEALLADAVQPGAHVLDIGCGTGGTTAAIARRAGDGGRAVGVDISEPMIAAARRRASSAEFIRADAQDYRFEPESFDLIASRFGVMFFSDPVAAFTNLARAVRPGGRLAAAVWQTRDRVPLFDLPYQTAVQVLDRRGLAYEPIAADALQCSLGSAEVVHAVLEPAGWRQVEARPTARSLYLGGEFTVEQAAREAVDIGPIRMLLEGQPDEVREEVRAELAQAFAPRHDGTGVKVPGGFMIITARR